MDVSLPLRFASSRSARACKKVDFDKSFAWDARTLVVIRFASRKFSAAFLRDSNSVLTYKDTLTLQRLSASSVTELDELAGKLFILRLTNVNFQIKQIQRRYLTVEVLFIRAKFSHGDIAGNVAGVCYLVCHTLCEACPKAKITSTLLNYIDTRPIK
jgi:hypothetical protein